MNRKQTKLFRFAVDLFIEIIEKVSKRPKVKYQANDKDTEAFENWFEYFGANVGEEFMKRFLEFQMTWYFDENREVKLYWNARLQWFLSKEAIRRWEKNRPKTNTFIVRKFKLKNDIDLSKGATIAPKWVSELRNVEESFKGRFFGESKGFIWCKANTTLYFHESAFCSACKFATECRELLKKEYPKIYNRRGYDK